MHGVSWTKSFTHTYTCIPYATFTPANTIDVSFSVFSTFKSYGLAFIYPVLSWCCSGLLLFVYNFSGHNFAVSFNLWPVTWRMANTILYFGIYYYIILHSLSHHRSAGWQESNFVSFHWCTRVDFEVVHARTYTQWSMAWHAFEPSLHSPASIHLFLFEIMQNVGNSCFRHPGFGLSLFVCEWACKSICDKWSRVSSSRWFVLVHL